MEQEKQIIINITNLKKHYGDLTAVDGLSFQIYEGEIFGFLGPNGAGKTTSINMICGLLPVTEGEITIRGKRFKNSNELKALIGYCPQDNIYWPKLTCREQLIFMDEMYGIKRDPARKRADELLELLGLSQKANIVASKLSGGMKRRLNICLALIHDPHILILDEPEAGLDPQSRILVRNFIKALSREKTIILTTHNMDEADRLADRVAIIDHGKLLMLDTPHNLKNSIGEGDIIEITLNMHESSMINILNEDLSRLCCKVQTSGDKLVIRSKNLLSLLPDIIHTISGYGFKINEITMRQNTLEDVFIHLTGRTLRQ